MIRPCAVLFVLLSAAAASAVEFTDDFTDNNFTQANWTFQSPYQCANPALGTDFNASGTAANGQLCMNSTFPVPPPLGGPAPTTAIAWVNSQTFTGNVAVYAGVKFTAQELADNDAGTRRVIKQVLIRYDPRPNGGADGPLGPIPTCLNSDGGETYILNMDPTSGGVGGAGGNDFAILRVDNNFDEVSLASGGFLWEPDVQYYVYFAAEWDPVANTNHLRAILYTTDPTTPLAERLVDDDVIKPGTIDPANTGNDRVALLVTDNKGGVVTDYCMEVNGALACGAANNKFLATDQLLPSGELPDADQDGVKDLCDECPNTIAAAVPVLDTHGCPPLIPGDVDRDGDVDLTDRDLFIGCALGPEIPLIEPACDHADADGDGDGDQDDFGLWQRCFNGANVLPPTDCGD